MTDPQGTAHGGAAPAPRGAGPLRPLNLGDVLDGMFRLLVRHWRTYVGAVAVVIVPPQLLLAYLQRDLVEVGLLDVWSDPIAAQATTAPWQGLGMAFLGTIATMLLVTPLVTGVAALIGARAHLGDPVTARDALVGGLRGYGALVAANLLSLLAVAAVAAVLALPLLGLVAAGAPPLVVVLLSLPLAAAALAAAVTAYTLLLVGPVAIVVEGAGPLTALARSVRLVRRRFWPVLGIGLLAWLISTVIGSVLSWPFALPAALFGGTLSLALTTLGALVAGIAAAPLMPNALALLYVDLRVRTEGLDVEAMADALELPPEGPGPA